MTTVKNKIRSGTLFLFLLLLLTSGIGIYSLVRLKNDTRVILKDNYESIDFSHQLQSLLDSSPGQTGSLREFDRVLQLQERNITEPGEATATQNIRNDFEQYRNGDTSSVRVRQLRNSINHILQLNMHAIEQKNARAGKTAERALAYLSLLAAIVFLVGFTFAYNFPTVLTGPVGVLTEGIQEISRKNYQYRIHLDRKDEFGEMAQAFNEMAERLEYFENSNLNRIIFEKTRAEAVINSLRDASIGIDSSQVVLFANNQALQLLSLRAVDIVGKPVADVASRNDLFRFLLEEKTNMPFKIVVDNRENYFIKEQLSIGEDAERSRVIVLRNITSFKELDVARTNFIATISHELKTPLASSDLSLKLLEDTRTGMLSDSQKELVADLRKDNQRMLRILSELLNMSQVEAGKIQLDKKMIAPVMLLEKAIATVSTLAAEKKIRFERKFEPIGGNWRVDEEKTGWVLNNLLANAIRHSPEESTVTISIQQKNEMVQVRVADQGPGIPSEYLSKVFERFFTIPGSTAKGTGLGLAISKELIEAQDGRIWVESDYGAGARFNVELPVQKDK